jgi:hypothetical protein
MRKHHRFGHFQYSDAPLAAIGAIDAHAEMPISPTPVDTSPNLRWHVEYAIERLKILVDEDPEANVLSDMLKILHRGLEGGPAGLTGVGAKCPVCGCRNDKQQRHKERP